MTRWFSLLGMNEIMTREKKDVGHEGLSVETCRGVGGGDDVGGTPSSSVTTLIAYLGINQSFEPKGPHIYR